jgi:hypothetical protein
MGSKVAFWETNVTISDKGELITSLYSKPSEWTEWTVAFPLNAKKVLLRMSCFVLEESAQGIS